MAPTASSMRVLLLLSLHGTHADPTLPQSIDHESLQGSRAHEAASAADSKTTCVSTKQRSSSAVEKCNETIESSLQTIALMDSLNVESQLVHMFFEQVRAHTHAAHPPALALTRRK